MAGDVRAPELDAGLGWFNTNRPLRFDGDLKGRIVVLDFWTYCCINCIHILPDLKYLEEKYASEPVVFIGVHSAKFTNEASRETIRAAVLRYEIEHPVVIDDQMKIWRAFAARSWPTLNVVDSTGRVCFVTAGEGNRDALDQAIEEALKQGKANDTLADGPLKLAKEASVRSTGGLAFPGKVLADAETNKLYIADSNHNRVVIAELPDDAGRAKVLKTIGSGEIGFADGPAETATFDHPQGLAISMGVLYVADTENHAIRAIDLRTFEVTTAVGTGEMDNDRAGGGMGTAQGLNSPWDLVSEGGTLYVAMAGVHQIWRIDMPVGFARAFAGTGRENIADGPTEQAALSQPSGICMHRGNLYFADSEVSAIRGIDMAAERVFTVIGQGLFSFGDVDGVQPNARLQHPLGVAPYGASLLVADTYNHKIKSVDPGAKSVRTLYGTGKPGARTEDGSLELFEPGGLSALGDDVFIADTNNHRIVRIDLKTNAWHEIVLEGLEAPGGRDVEDQAPNTAVIDASKLPLAGSGKTALAISAKLPDRGKLSPDAPWSVRVSSGTNTLAQVTGHSDRFPISVPLARAAKEGSDIEITASFAWCLSGDAAICIPAELRWRGTAATGDAPTVELTGEVEPPPTG